MNPKKIVEQWREFILNERSLGGLRSEVCHGGSCVGGGWLGLSESEQVAACEACPVRQQCLDYALVFEGAVECASRSEVWGGVRCRDRWRLYREWRKRGVERYALLRAGLTTPEPPMLPGFSAPSRSEKELAEIGRRMRIELLPEVPEVPENVFEARLVAAVKAVRVA